MPELPEVETLCRQLKKKICGKEILSTAVFDDKLKSIKGIKGRRIVAVERKGKMIAVILDDGNIIFIHLRMTGRLLWQKISSKRKHSRWRMSFADGNVFLVDPRRFATIRVSQEEKNAAGSEIFRDFDLKNFVSAHGSRRTKVKSLIMDQNAVSGIGNIYACEILYEARIHPERAAATLKEAEWRKIFHQAKIVLQKAIGKRGTSISDWRDLYGRKGENQHELKVYGQEGKQCMTCGGTVRRIKQGGRSTFYCPGCQK